MSGKVMILSGIPGCGKSLVAAHYSEHEGYTQIFSADRFFEGTGEARAFGQGYIFDGGKLAEAHGKCLRAFINALSCSCAGLLVVDNTNIGIEEIAPYYAAAEAWGWKPTIVEFWPGADNAMNFFEWSEFCRSRCAHQIPPHTMERRRDQFHNRTLPRRWNVIKIIESEVSLLESF